MTAFVGALLLVGAACAEIGEPDLGVGSPAPRTDATQSGDALDPSESDAAADEANAEIEAAPLPVFSPPRPDGYLPSLVIVGVDRASVFDGPLDQASAIPLSFGSGTVVPDRVVDDFFGGVVVQDQVEGEDGASIQTVTWFRPSDDLGTVLAEGAQLLDVGFIDSTLEAHALVVVDGNSVDRIKLVDGERAPFAVLGEGQVLVDLSASEGLHAVVVSDTACGDLVFWNSSGEVVDVGGPSAPPCAVDRRPTYGAVDLNPDATQVAYTVLTYRSDGVVATTDLVVRELGSSAVVFTASVGGPGQDIRRLSFDGTRLAFIRSDTEQTQVVVLSTEGELSESIVGAETDPNEAVFARQPLTVGRPAVSETDG